MEASRLALGSDSIDFSNDWNRQITILVSILASESLSGSSPSAKRYPCDLLTPPGDRPEGQPIENPTVLLCFPNPSPGLKSDTFSRPAASSADPEKESAHICRERKKYGQVSFHDFGICFGLVEHRSGASSELSGVESEPIRSPFHPTRTFRLHFYPI